MATPSNTQEVATPEDAAQELVDWLKEQLGPEGATNAFEARMVFEELPDTFPQAASWPEAARRKAKQGAVATVNEFKKAHKSRWTPEVAIAFQTALTTLVLDKVRAPLAVEGGAGAAGAAGAPAAPGAGAAPAPAAAGDGGGGGDETRYSWWHLGSYREGSTRDSGSGGSDNQANGAGAGAGAGVGEVQLTVDDAAANDVEATATALRDVSAVITRRAAMLEAHCGRGYPKARHRLSCWRHYGHTYAKSNACGTYFFIHMAILLVALAALLVSAVALKPEPTDSNYALLRVIKEVLLVGSIFQMGWVVMRLLILLAEDRTGDESGDVWIGIVCMVACVWLLLMGSFRVVRETLTMQLIGVAETGAAAGFAMRALDLWRVHSAALFVCDTYPKQSYLLAFFNELDARAKAAKPDELRAAVKALKLTKKGTRSPSAPGSDGLIQMPWVTHKVTADNKDNVALLQNSSNKDAKAKEVQFIIQQVDARKLLWPPQSFVLFAILAKDRGLFQATHRANGHVGLDPRDVRPMLLGNPLYLRYLWPRRLRMGFVVALLVASGVIKVLARKSDVMSPGLQEHAPMIAFLGHVVGAALFIQMWFKQFLDMIPVDEHWVHSTRIHDTLSRYLATVFVPAGLNATWMMALGLRIAIVRRKETGLNWAGYGVFMAGVAISTCLYFMPSWVSCRTTNKTPSKDPAPGTLQPVTWSKVWRRSRQVFVEGYGPSSYKNKDLYMGMSVATLTWWTLVWLACGIVAATQIGENYGPWRALGITGLVMLALGCCCGCNSVNQVRIRAKRG